MGPDSNESQLFRKGRPMRHHRTINGLALSLREMTQTIVPSEPLDLRLQTEQFSLPWWFKGKIRLFRSPLHQLQLPSSRPP